MTFCYNNATWQLKGRIRVQEESVYGCEQVVFVEWSNLGFHMQCILQRQAQVESYAGLNSIANWNQLSREPPEAKPLWPIIEGLKWVKYGGTVYIWL